MNGQKKRHEGVTYPFTNVLQGDSSAEELFETCGRKLLDAYWENGSDAVLLAYGAARSGKVKKFWA